MKVAVIFDRFGPYHVARLTAAAQYVSLIPLELFGVSSEYKWDKVEGPDNKVTVFLNQSKGGISPAKLFRALQQLLNTHQPDAVAINGWSDKGALSALYWCLKNGVPAIVMSESAAMDEKRIGWREAIKRNIVGFCAAGLAGGSRHTAYLVQLGMPANAIFTGYDVIDNDYFKNETERIRKHEPYAREKLGLPRRYFLASNRFVPKKNLAFLIQAFADYRRQAAGTPYDLILLGDGELQNQLLQLIDRLRLKQAVHLPGFKQYGELPYYYAFAEAFIHSSTSEQWGLVVNEAMAAGLPVIVSQRCGCVPELVADGVNGCSFDPFNAPALTRLLLTVSGNEDSLRLMGLKSRQIIGNWQPDQFGKGLLKAAEKAVATPRRSFSLIDRIFLKSLIFR